MGRADWYRNIRANPALEIRTGQDSYIPAQRFLAREEVYAEIADYERRHPWVVRVITHLLGFRINDEASVRAFAESLRMVAFRPRDDSN